MRTVKLSEVLQVRNERHPNDGTYPLCSLTIENGLIEKPDRYIREFLVKNPLKPYKKIYPGDIVFNPMNLRWGAISASRLPSVVIASPVYEVLILRNSEAADLDYLLQFFKSARFMNLVNTYAEGTLVERTSVNLKSFMKLEVPIPSLEEQRSIAAVLNSTDRVIEKTRNVIAHVHRVKLAFREKVITCGILNLKNGSSPSHLPDSWKILRLGDLLREPIRNGYSPNASPDETGAWILGLNSITFNGYDPTGIKPAPTGNMRLLSYKLIANDLLISRSNTRDRVGLAGIYSGVPSNCYYPDLLMRVRLNDSIILPQWLEQWLLSRAGRIYFEQQARGTSGSMVKINKKIVEDFLLAVPSISEQQKVLAFYNSINTRFHKETTVMGQAIFLKNSLMTSLLKFKSANDEE